MWPLPRLLAQGPVKRVQTGPRAGFDKVSRSKLDCKTVASLPPSLPPVSPPQEKAHKKAMQELQKTADATAKELKEVKGQLQNLTEVSDNTVASKYTMISAELVAWNLKGQFLVL